MKVPQTAALSVLVATVLSSPILEPKEDAHAQSTCVIDIFRPAPRRTDCTFLAETVTETIYTECGGCTLRTRRIGYGLPCRRVTMIPGTTYTTKTTCAELTAYPRKQIHHKVAPRATSSTPSHISTATPRRTTPTTTVTVENCKGMMLP
ncbi:hypothetical protein K504DRAFT_538360 [Pleomassaria siparia CBS 279.74]|uniref:Uncharacterized protein n=1 Tax=Pleomassaria siparia CBS 279.74 TaxID=1314801 RepID=A0A6G1JTR5_9PLEO|nr:hypothetical protein K504DRAFT_538360 [Pleomassaria siparia CBS 279.74]